MRSLVPCVDQIRDLNTCFGLRSYSVSLVATRWSGGRRGVGVEEVIRDEAILPTPLVSGVGELERQLSGLGTEEFGGVTISEISARYTEDQLLGRQADGSAPPPDETFWWEIRAVLPSEQTARRRFQLSAAPVLDMTSLQWTVKLARASEDRTRQLGSLRSA